MRYATCRCAYNIVYKKSDATSLSAINRPGPLNGRIKKKKNNRSNYKGVSDTYETSLGSHTGLSPGKARK
jgi:hypothetical protein